MKKIIIVMFALLPLVGLGQKIEQGFAFEYATTSSLEIYENVGGDSDAFRGCVKDSRCEKNLNRYIKSFKGGEYVFQYQIRASYKVLFLKSDTYISMNKDKGVRFAPRLATFNIKGGIRIWKCKAYISHQCLHCLDSKSNIDMTRLCGGYTKIGISYNIK